MKLLPVGNVGLQSLLGQRHRGAWRDALVERVGDLRLGHEGAVPIALESVLSERRQERPGFQRGARRALDLEAEAAVGEDQREEAGPASAAASAESDASRAHGTGGGPARLEVEEHFDVRRFAGSRSRNGDEYGQD